MFVHRRASGVKYADVVDLRLLFELVHILCDVVWLGRGWCVSERWVSCCVNMFSPVSPMLFSHCKMD